MLAVKTNRVKVVDMFLAMGNLDVNYTNDFDQSALTIALELTKDDKYVIINKLLEAGARFPCKKRKLVTV